MRTVATFYGGPLDGATTTRHATYLDDYGQPVPTGRGDRAWLSMHTVNPRRFYARQPVGRARAVYVHWTAAGTWRATHSAAS